jgi:hypothetical protein
LISTCHLKNVWVLGLFNNILIPNLTHLFFIYKYNILCMKRKKAYSLLSLLCLMMCFECAFDFVTYITSHIHLIFNGHYISSYFLWNLHFVTTYFVYVQIFLVFSNQSYNFFFGKPKSNNYLCLYPCISHAIISLRCSELLTFLYT